MRVATRSLISYQEHYNSLDNWGAQKNRLGNFEMDVTERDREYEL